MIRGPGNVPVFTVSYFAEAPPHTNTHRSLPRHSSWKPRYWLPTWILM